MEQANAQTKIIERDIARLAEDHAKLNQRFDRHLEIYSQNGKELAALKTKVENLDKAVQAKCDEIMTMLRENRGMYATKEEVTHATAMMSPIKAIVYGSVGLIITSVFGALIALVIRS
jgi:predicted phage tail protein